MEKTLPLLSAFPKGTTIVKNTAEESSEKKSEARVSIDAVKIRQEAGKEVMPDLTGLPKRAALTRIEGKGLIIKVSGNGRLIDQVPKAGTLIERGDLCYLKFDI
jgi:beta-lactam-binding protein with PASTA domain